MQSTLGSVDPQSVESAVAEFAEVRVVGDWSNLQLPEPAVPEPQMRNPADRRITAESGQGPWGYTVFRRASNIPGFWYGWVVCLGISPHRYPGKAELGSLLDN